MITKNYFLAPLLGLLAATQVASQEPLTAELAATSHEHEQLLLDYGIRERQKLVEAELAFETQLNEAFLRLDQAIALINSEDFTGERLAVSELRRIISLMRTEVVDVIDMHEKTIDAARDYGNRLTRAKPTILVVAGTFEKYAQAEEYHDLADDYRLWAKTFIAVANKAEEKRTQVIPSISAISGNLNFVKRTAVLLERLDKFLQVMPEEGPSNKEFLSKLAAYVKAFETLRDKLRLFHGAEVSSHSDKVKIPAKDAVNSPAAKPATMTEEERRQTARYSMDTAKLLSVMLEIDGKVPGTRLVSTTPAEPSETAASMQATASAPEPKPMLGVTGIWKVLPGDLVLRLTEEEDFVEVRLVRSSQYREAAGQFRKEGAQMIATDYSYQLRAGDKLDLDGTTFTRLNDDELAAIGPRYRRDSRGKINRSRYKNRYQLIRLH